MRHFIIISFSFFCNLLFSQPQLATIKNCNPKIRVDDGSVVLNKDTFWTLPSKSKAELNKYLNNLGKKYKKTKDNLSGGLTISYYKTGIEIYLASLKNNYPSNMIVHFRKNKSMIYKKGRCFKDCLLFFGIEINSETTFERIYNAPEIRDLIDTSYYKTSSEVNKGFIIINTKNGSYSLHFDTKNNNIIENISFSL